MTPKFEVRVRSFETIDSLPSAWGHADYRGVLELLEFDDVASVPDSDLREMALMALQDLPPDDAAECVLKLRLGDRLTPGQRQELSHEMLEDRVWDEYPEMSAHEELFNASVLLHAAFPTHFPPATAVSLVLELTAANEAACAELEEITEPLLCRALADGMSERCILSRLFGDQLRGAPFPEAEHIVWRFEVESRSARQAVVSLLTTLGWVGELRDADAFPSTASGDRAVDEDDEDDEDDDHDGDDDAGQAG